MKKIIIIFIAFFTVGLTAGAQTQTPPKKIKLNKTTSKNRMLVAAQSKQAKDAANRPNPEAKKEGE